MSKYNVTVVIESDTVANAIYEVVNGYDGEQVTGISEISAYEVTE